MAYRDSSWMTTVGGFFGDAETGASLTQTMTQRHSFLFGEPNEGPFVLEQFNITEQERLIFDRSATTKRGRSAARNQLERLGFRQTIITQYRDLMRFIPRYVETVF